MLKHKWPKCLAFYIILIGLSGCLWNPDLPLPEGISWIDPSNDKAYDTLSWSPDSTKIAFTRYEAIAHPFGRRSETGEIYVFERVSNETIQLTHNKFEDSHPAWSPDGSHIVYTRNEIGYIPPDYTLVYTYSLRVINSDGTEDRQICLCPLSCGTPSWSPDGKRIAFYQSSSDVRDPNDVDGPPNHLYTINSDGTGLMQLTKQASHPLYPEWSPDGNKILFEDWRRDWIQIIDVRSRDVITLTIPDLKYAGDPTWLADQSGIGFVASEPGRGIQHLYTFDLSSESVEPILLDENNDFPLFPTDPAWSPDGKYLVFIEHDSRMYIVDLAAVRK